MRRLVRRSTTVLGGCMVLCGLVLASPLLPVGLLAVAANPTLPGVTDAAARAREVLAILEATASGTTVDGSALRPDRIRALVLASAAWVLASVLLIVLGFKLLRRHRALVLFLRRFGHHDATTAVSFAVATTIGSGWRLVTLDDGGVEPMGTRRAIRAVLAAVRHAVVLTRLPAICGHVLAATAGGMVAVLAVDLLLAVYARDGWIEMARVQATARQLGASVMLLLDEVAAEAGVGATVVLTVGSAALAVVLAFKGLRALRRLRPRALRGGPPRRGALRLMRRTATIAVQILVILVVIEVSRSIAGLGGALAADAWWRLAEPYVAVLGHLLDGRLPAGWIAPSLPGVFALLACAGALAALTAVVAVIVMIGTGVLLAPLWLFLSSSTKAMARADRNHLAIGSAWELARITAQVEAASRYALAPRLVVLRVHSAIWQRAVRSFLDASSVALIDVSDPTPNVLWELDLITATGAPCVAIAEYSSVTALAHTATGATGHDMPAQRLAHLLEGRQVLAYTTGREGITRFAHALRNQLLEASLAPERTATSPGAAASHAPVPP